MKNKILSLIKSSDRINIILAFRLMSKHWIYLKIYLNYLVAYSNVDKNDKKHYWIRYHDTMERVNLIINDRLFGNGRDEPMIRRIIMILAN